MKDIIEIKEVAQWRSFGGWFKRYQHHSTCLNCDMHFTVYLPPQAEQQAVPVLYWLSGLTCTDENFVIKAGAQRIAAELGIAIIIPDTSPRGTNLPGEHDDINIGSGASFYLNATQAPWKQHYQMYDYIVDELPQIVNSNFPVTELCSISGHSMGGHGALVIALRNPGKYCSVSAFAPVANPTGTEKGRQRFSAYLGDDEFTWKQYDATLLVATATEKLPLLVDQGDEDEMILGLRPKALEQACIAADYPLTLRMQKGYDHSYFFVATFIEEHLRYHFKALSLEP